MKMFAGIILGFALTPALIAFMGLFIWASVRFRLSWVDIGLGYALGLATLIVIAGIGISMAARS